MLTKLFVLLSAVVVLGLVPDLPAQEKDDKAAQAKMVGEQFGKVLLANDFKDVTKVVSVPFLFPSPDVGTRWEMIEKLDQFMAAALKKAGNIDPKLKDPLDKLMKKNDRVVVLRLMIAGNDEPMTAAIMVAWRDGQARVVGFTHDLD